MVGVPAEPAETACHPPINLREDDTRRPSPPHEDLAIEELEEAEVRVRPNDLRKVARHCLEVGPEDALSSVP
jgi:hypothetical protein